MLRDADTFWAWGRLLHDIYVCGMWNKECVHVSHNYSVSLNDSTYVLGGRVVLKELKHGHLLFRLGLKCNFRRARLCKIYIIIINAG